MYFEQNKHCCLDYQSEIIKHMRHKEKWQIGNKMLIFLYIENGQVNKTTPFDHPPLSPFRFHSKMA